MAKNLKLNIKNAQLAEALKKLKKPEAPEEKKKPEPKEAPPPPPPPPPKEEVAPPAPAPEAEKVEEAPPAPKPPAPRPASTVLQPRPPYRPAPRPPLRRETMSSGPRPAPRHAPGQAPGARPPFMPGTGARPAPRPYTPRPGGPRPGAPRPGGPPRPGFRGPPVAPAPMPKEGEEKRTKKAAVFKDFRDFKAQRKPGDEKSFDARDRQGLRAGEDEIWRRKRRAGGKRMETEEQVIRPKALKVRLPITIKDLAAEMKLKASQLLSSLFMKGVVLTLNDALDDETTVQLLGHDFQCEITIDTSEEERIKITDKTIKQEITESPADELILRPPVVTFMGHVDHGKTSLIDAIRKSNVAAGEAGAITQHIGAFKCHTAVGDLAVLDTPGHEAFSAMRERGADVTDIVVLVIAGDEGIRAQTVEAMNQAKVAGVPIMVALNKSDKPNFNAENIYRQLAEHELLPETWGGTTITVNCSALTGAGIPQLLEMLALQAEILELRANPATRARGTVIESQMHKGLGAVATVLVQNGTLRLGDAVVFDQHFGRVKSMHDEHGREMQEAGPSTPAKITGLSGLPEAGSEFIVVKNEKEARELSEKRILQRKHTLLQVKRGGLENLLAQQVQKQEKKMLAVILRADVQGSLEALKHSLEKIKSEKIELNITSAEVGEVSESDIELAAASKAVILGFHTAIESRADSLIKQHKVNVRLHDIIYHAVDDVKQLMIDLLDKIPQENDIGEAAVKAVFKSSQLGLIAGCQVTDGIIRRNSHVRVVRDKEVIWKGPLASLKRVKEDVREVSKGHECGILLQGFTDIKEGDTLQAFDITYLTQEL
ncbi:MAG: translation initiation factor IF-2 [Verrucomicrobia bacterium]|nr:translation initiation factor IF-2 [Verrucomicrobiota bacterium]